MRWFYLIIFLAAFSVSSCSLLEQSQEYERFIQCDFSLHSVEIIEVGGVDMSAIERPADIGMLQVMSLTQQLMSGSLPAKMEIKLNAKNSNNEKASIMGLDWQLMLEGNELLNGEIDRYVEVSPQSATVFPVTTTVDLLKIIETKSLDQLLNFVLSENKESKLGELGVAIKIRPHYRAGSQTMKYPSWLTIRL